jgi:hypothetical protein
MGRRSGTQREGRTAGTRGRRGWSGRLNTAAAKQPTEQAASNRRTNFLSRSVLGIRGLQQQRRSSHWRIQREPHRAVTASIASSLHIKRRAQPRLPPPMAVQQQQLQQLTQQPSAHRHKQPTSPSRIAQRTTAVTTAHGVGAAVGAIPASSTPCPCVLCCCS